MTQSLAYNAQKRSMLDRLTAKYKRAFANVFAQALKELAPIMEAALVNEDLDFHVKTEHLDLLMDKILTQHQAAVVYTAVSDGMREITTDNKLGTWQSYPYWYPVEETFINLAERKVRDGIYTKVYGRLRKKYRSSFAEIIDLEKARFKKAVKSTYKAAARIYWSSEDEQDPKSAIKGVLITVHRQNENSAERTFRTETTRYFNEARVEYFTTNTSVDFMQVVAITDGRVSDICEHRNGYVIPAGIANAQKKYQPPYHYNCRSVLSPLITFIKSQAKKVEDNLGAEFQTAYSATSDRYFTGKRTLPESLNFNHNLPS